MSRHATLIVAVVLIGATCLSVAQLQANTFVVNSTTDEVDKTPGDGACSTAGGACTLRAAIQEVNKLPGSHLITLPAGVFNLTRAGMNEEDAATGDLDIKVDLTIQGAGMDATIVDGLGMDRVFHVPLLPVGIPVTISDMTIRGGNAVPAEGGAIHYMGAGGLSVWRVRFVNNTAGSGGAICHNTPAADTAIISCVFENNQAQGNGGAVYATGWSISVSGSSFASSSAGLQGGAMYLGVNGPVLIDNTVVLSSQSNGNGGSAWILSPGSLTVSNSRFESSTSKGHGGAMIFSGGGGSNLTITNTVFKSASANPGNGGGCWAVLGGSTNVSGCRFEGCSASSNGGGMIIAATAGVEIDGSEFLGNTASSGDGGGVHGTTSGPFSLSNTTVAANWAGKSAGGVYVENGRSQVNVLHCTFDHNSAQTVKGGGLYDAGGLGALTIYACSFSYNSVGNNGQGGGVCNQGPLGIGITDSTFCGNQAVGPTAKGGAVMCDGGPGSSFKNSTFSGNTAGSSGGAVMTNKSMTITSCTFAGNSAGLAGAAISRLAPQVTLKNTLIAASSAGMNCSGGAMTSANNNLDQDASCGLAGSEDQKNVDPLLGPLQNNGGGVLTHALLAGSPAIDAAAVMACEATDERGIGRPFDGNADGAAVCDIGAFEFIDCNGNGTDDGTDIQDGSAADCNHNATPDSCEIAAGFSMDCDSNGVPDECQADSDNNGVIDACEPSLAPAPTPCGACGLGAGMLMPFTLFCLAWMKQRCRAR